MHKNDLQKIYKRIDKVMEEISKLTNDDLGCGATLENKDKVILGHVTDRLYNCLEYITEKYPNVKMEL